MKLDKNTLEVLRDLFKTRLEESRKKQSAYDKRGVYFQDGKESELEFTILTLEDQMKESDDSEMKEAKEWWNALSEDVKWSMTADFTAHWSELSDKTILELFKD